MIRASAWINPRSGTWDLSGSRSTPKEFYLDKPWYCHKRAPDQILSKMCQHPCKLCKKLCSKMEAFKLEKFRGSIDLDRAIGETSVCEVSYLDRPFIRNMGLIWITMKIWMIPGGKRSRSCPYLEREADLNQGLHLDDGRGYPDLKAFDLDRALSVPCLDVEVSRSKKWSRSLSIHCKTMHLERRGWSKSRPAFGWVWGVF